MKRRGFTLIELLIVIIVIGVLAAMLILSSTEAVSRAKATKIISDLNLMKRAMNAWYMDNYSRLGKTKSDGFHIDAKLGKDGYYSGGSNMHDYFNKHSNEFSKYFSGSTVTFNSAKANWDHASRDQYGASVGNYGIYFGYTNTICYVLYRVSKHNDDAESQLKAKLKARAKLSGLLLYDYKAGNVKHKPYDGKAANVFMEAFKMTN